MKTLFTPFAIFAMALGIGVSLSAPREDVGVKAATVTETITFVNAGLHKPDIPDGTIDSARYTLTNTGSATFTASFTKNDSSTASIFNNTSNEVRLYNGAGGNGGQLTLDLEGGLFTSIAFSLSRNTGLSINGGGSITSTSIDETFTPTSTITLKAVGGGQVRMNALTIKYAVEVEEGPFNNLNNITLDTSHADFRTNFFVGSVFSSNNLVVTAHDDSTPANSKVVTGFTTNFDGYTFTLEDVGTKTVTVSYTEGTITKTATYEINITEKTIVEGTYTIDVPTTTYSAPMDPTLLGITKSNTDLDDLAFSDINNTRLNSGGSGLSTGNTITIGGSSSAGGEFTITVGEGLFVSEITFNDIFADSGKTPTLAINDGVSFTLGENANETLKPYARAVKISTLGTSRIWTKSIAVTVKKADNAATDFANYFLTKTGEECATLNVLNSTWSHFSKTVEKMDASVKDLLVGATPNVEGNVFEQMTARYNYIKNVYGYNDFFSGDYNLSAMVLRNNTTTTNNRNLIIIALISTLAITLLFVIKQRKQKVE